jgi:hypothetical protein
MKDNEDQTVDDSWGAAEQADQCRGRLLRARGERPSRCAAECRDEIAPSHIDSPAPDSQDHAKFSLNDTTPHHAGVG